jgi:putative ABC transport system substrate-binding protein
MKRREFITLLGGTTAAWPLAARAQQGERMRRIGVLMGFAEDDPQVKAFLAGLQQGLERLGWLEGRNVRIDYRYAPAANPAQAPALARELAILQPDVIVVQATPLVAALQRETRTIPIVFVGIADPIGSGFIESMVRPGGNLTGFMLFESSVVGKWLAMLKEIAPRLARAALVINPKSAPYYNFYLRAAEAAAPSLAIEIVPSFVEEATDIEHSIKALARVSNAGLVFPPDNMTNLHRDLIIALAAKHRLPAVYNARIWVAAGGLMSYGSVRVDQYRQAASYVDRILRGAKPADLPAQAPTKYETTLNLTTAKALGLTVPPGLLVSADEVIE